MNNQQGLGGGKQLKTNQIIDNNKKPIFLSHANPNLDLVEVAKDVQGIDFYLSHFFTKIDLVMATVSEVRIRTDYRGKQTIMQEKHLYRLKNKIDMHISAIGGFTNRQITITLSVLDIGDPWYFPGFLSLPHELKELIVSYMDLVTLLCFSLCRKNWRKFIKNDLRLPYADLNHYIPLGLNDGLKYQYKLLYRIRK